MLPTKSRKIGDCTYTTTLLSASEGLAINPLLYRALGPAVAELAANLPEGDLSLGDLPWAAVTAAVKELTLRLDEADLRTLTTKFAAVTEVTLPDGKKPRLNDVFDVHFAGKYARMYQWLLFCLEANFADFLEVVQPLRQKAPPAPAAG